MLLGTKRGTPTQIAGSHSAGRGRSPTRFPCLEEQVLRRRRQPPSRTDHPKGPQFPRITHFATFQSLPFRECSPAGLQRDATVTPPSRQVACGRGRAAAPSFLPCCHTRCLLLSSLGQAGIQHRTLILAGGMNQDQDRGKEEEWGGRWALCKGDFQQRVHNKCFPKGSSCLFLNSFS